MSLLSNIKVKLYSKDIFAFLYVILLFLAFLYGKSILSSSSVKEQVKENQTSIETRIVTVRLTYLGQNFVDKSLKNTDTVFDLLSSLRDDKKISFERVDHLNNVELTEINGVTTPEGYSWRIFYNNADITNNIGSTYLNNDDTFDLKLVKN